MIDDSVKRKVIPLKNRRQREMIRCSRRAEQMARQGKSQRHWSKFW